MWQLRNSAAAAAAAKSFMKKSWIIQLPESERNWNSHSKIPRDRCDTQMLTHTTMTTLSPWRHHDVIRHTQTNTHTVWHKGTKRDTKDIWRRAELLLDAPARSPRARHARVSAATNASMGHHQYTLYCTSEGYPAGPILESYHTSARRRKAIYIPKIAEKFRDSACQVCAFSTGKWPNRKWKCVEKRGKNRKKIEKKFWKKNLSGDFGPFHTSDRQRGFRQTVKISWKNSKGKGV